MDIDLKNVIDNFTIVEDENQQKDLKKEQVKKEYDEYFKNSNIPQKYRTAYKNDIDEKLWQNLLSKRFCVLKGGLGTGKTHLACSYLNTANIKSGINGFFVRCHVLETLDLNELKAFLNSCKNRKIVVIDDLGMIRANDFVKRQMASFILYRAEENKRTIITANESLEDIFDDRIYDKIKEDFELIEIIGENRRKKK